MPVRWELASKVPVWLRGAEGLRGPSVAGHTAWEAGSSDLGHTLVTLPNVCYGESWYQPDEGESQ